MVLRPEVPMRNLGFSAARCVGLSLCVVTVITSSLRPPAGDVTPRAAGEVAEFHENLIAGSVKEISPPVSRIQFSLVGLVTVIVTGEREFTEGSVIGGDLTDAIPITDAWAEDPGITDAIIDERGEMVRTPLDGVMGVARSRARCLSDASVEIIGGAERDI